MIFFSFVRSSREWSGGLCGRRLDGLHLELDVDAIADEDATCLEQLGPVQAEVLSIEGGRRDEPSALVAPRVLRAAAVLDVEDDLATDVADGEVTRHAVALARHLLDSRAAKLHLREAFDLEEIRRAEMRVALGHAGVDAGDIDGRFDGRLGEIVVVQDQVAAEAGKAASNFGYHHVPDRKADA